MKGKRNIAIINLGCPRNLVDSEVVLGRLSLKGYRIVEDIEDADIGIINTCAFIKDAKTESIDVLLDLIDLKKQDKLKKIIAYGCLVERYGNKLANEFPEVDAFVGRISLNHSADKFSLTPSHYAYLKICEGCVNNCSYCAIPKIKGEFQSLDFDSLIKKAEFLDKKGISELNIIGQDITAYGRDLYKKDNLPFLLEGILKKTENISWFRLLYLYPSRISNDLLKLIADSGRLCSYIDLPIQHINNRILRLMNRRIEKKEILNLIERIRRFIPEVAIRTSLIVGFPSETDKEFKELVDFVEDIRFERLGVFIYSREEGTPAYNFKRQIPQKIKERRFDTIMTIQQEISRKINSRYLGRVIDVLIDQKEDGCFLGRSQHDAPEVDGLVYVNSGLQLHAGDIVKVKINDTLDYDLVGEVCR